MGQILQDKVFLNANIFQFEKRLESQYTIFLDKIPTFVTYYHISVNNSMTDSGFLNVDEIVGNDSPIKFQKIDDFPIYGIEAIQLDLSDEDEGLNSSYESEGIILPNTIKPLPNDYFTITYLSKEYIFMVNNIDYDTIKSNNFYKINFHLKSISDQGVDNLNRQVLEKYQCIFDNIGTDDKCLILEDEMIKLNQLMEIYHKISKKYMTYFYSNKYNSVIFDTGNGNFLYDRYLTYFINKNQLLKEDRSYRSLFLSNEGPCCSNISIGTDYITVSLETPCAWSWRSFPALLYYVCSPAAPR
jgi:hypothetical protein